MLTHERHWAPQFESSDQREVDKLSLGEQSNDSSDGRASGMTDESEFSADLASGSLTHEDLNKIELLKEKLGTEFLESAPLMNDDYTLHRWITGWDNNYAEIVPRFRHTAAVLSALKADAFRVDGPDDVNTNLVQHNRLASFFAGGVMGYDRAGDVISCSLLGRVHPRQLVRCGCVHDSFELSVLDAAMTVKLLRLQEARLGRQAACKIIMDLDGLCMEHLFTPTVKIYLNLIRLLQDMFPELTRKIFVINSPTIFTTAFALIKPALSEKTRAKVEILGTDYQKALCEQLGAENLYPMYGGTKIAAHGCLESGTLRMGGVPSNDLKYDPTRHPRHVDDARLAKLNVPARSRRSVEVECRAGRRLRWFFKASGDLDVWVHAAERLCAPKWRLSTEFVPEFGEVQCEADGVHTIVFDNSFSTFFSKDVRYWAQMD